MSSNSFGNKITITTFGESHGIAIGVILDGIEPGFTIDPELIQNELDRRKPGQSSITTPRKESDTVHILSGLFENKTLGSPIAMIINNSDHHSADYSAIKDVYRPGHADLTYQLKYGLRDHRGGGRSSGRETAARVAAGAIAKQLLNQIGITITAYTKELAGISCDTIDLEEIEKNSLRAPDPLAAQKMLNQVQKIIDSGDSCGGIIECICDNIPAGLGDPMFDKLDANLAHAIVSIGAVKGIEFGKGFEVAALLGSENNDSFDGKKFTNHAGGILGGISSGEQIVFRCPVKPTPSISQQQQAMNALGELETIEIKGRHDPCICPRIIPVIESMTALTILDAYYSQFGKILK